MIDYTVKWEPIPCPNLAHPLHHFIHSPWRESIARNENANQNVKHQGEIYAFQCSSTTCSATVFVQLLPPRLSSSLVLLLTDKAQLKQRRDEAFEVGAGRLEGMRPPSAVEVMTDLRSYLRNAWAETKENRPINLDNKRFMLRFGPEGRASKDLLEFIGFTLDVSAHR